MSEEELISYKQNEDKRKAEHYVGKWISEQGFPNDRSDTALEKWALKLIEYTVSMMRIAMETDDEQTRTS